MLWSIIELSWRSVVVYSAMFDWNDEVLANIICGEACETDDHIVPYPEGNEDRPTHLYGDHIKKEWIQEAANTRPRVKNKSVNKIDYDGDKQKSASQYDSAEGIGCRMEPRPYLSLSPAAQTYDDSVGTEITRFDSSRDDVTSQLDESNSIFHNQHGDREQSDFVCYDWDNIGSFDDLGRIFSDDEEIFGHVCLDTDDTPWLSSEAATSCAEKSFMDSIYLGLGTSGSAYGHLKLKTEYAKDQDRSFIQDFGKMSYLSSHAQSNVHASAHQVNCTGGKREAVSKEKDSCCIRSPHGIQAQHFGVPRTCSSSVLSDQTQFQKCNSSVSPSVHGAIIKSHPTMTNLPLTHSRGEEKPVLPGFEFFTSSTNPFSRFPETFTKPLTMTPQEKIGKLRRRQQMMALLAIHRQQQQFSDQVSSIDYSISKKCHNDQIHPDDVEENVSTLLSIDPKLPIETPMVVDDCYSVDAATFHSLRDVVDKLDNGIRLCIRDSLFRLTLSAMQRHYAGDTISANKNSPDELEVPKEDTSSHSGFTRILDLETQTNRIDRAVAHLLFHIPEFSENHLHTPESPSSTKLPHEKNTSGLLCFPKRFSADSCRRNQNIHSFAEEHSENCCCVEAAENGANEALYAKGMEIGACDRHG